jgi:hypothetical protein
MISFALVLLFPIAGLAADGFRYLSLPSATSINAVWDIFEEVEHKGGPATDWKSSSCVSKDDLVTRFPIEDRTGRYSDYLSRYQRGHTVEISSLGMIGDVDINEVIHRFSEPIDYVKLLTFTPPKSKLLCPFLHIAEWNGQLQYSKSTIVVRDRTTVIATSMVDKIAGKHPELMNVDFTLQQGVPKRIRFEYTEDPSLVSVPSRRN